jgi:hypothetical protein
MFGFYRLDALLHFIAEGLLWDWRPRGEWPGAKAWALTRTARAIAGRVQARWKCMLAKADAQVLAVHRAVFRATFHDAPLMFNPAFYEDRYFVKDVIAYRAAAAAAVGALLLCRRQVRNLLRGAPRDRPLRERASRLGMRCLRSLRDESGSWCLAEGVDEAVLLGQLREWKGLFSCDGRAYGALNRTLMGLPGGVPAARLCDLALIRLERPVTRRLELLALLAYARAAFTREENLGDGDLFGTVGTAHVFQHATEGQIKEAMRRASAHTGTPWSPRRSRDVGAFVRFLADFRGRHEGNLVGLAEKSIRWHRDSQRQEVEDFLQCHPAATPLAAPPVAAPDIPGVRLLATVGDVAAEAEAMQHYVITYAEEAMRGDCYLFHVTYRGEEATLEVSRSGYVLQVSGPRNRRNKAAAWGARVLRQWGAGFPSEARAGAYGDDWL